MSKAFDSISPELQRWILKQRMFFVATAPLAATGHVNCSPKGGDSLRVMGPNAVAYQDLTGSGIETIAHLRENGRIVIMFCAFEGAPKIVRLYGRGEVIETGDSRFPLAPTAFPAHAGTRAIIHVEVERVGDSCGYAVPLYDFVADRTILDEWVERKGPEGVAQYQRRNNAVSIDGLPGLREAR